MIAKNGLRPAAGLAALLCLLLAPPTGRAALLPIELNSEGPIVLGIGTLSYDAATGTFRSETDPLAYSSLLFPDGTFLGGRTVIDFRVDLAGNFVANGGGVRVTGDVDLDNDGTADATGDDANPLLAGRVYAFGAEAAGPPTRVFNGLWVIEGGRLTESFALSGGGTFSPEFPAGSLAGGFFLFAETATTGTLGDFSASFASDSVKDNLGVVVPEPAGLCLALVGGAGLVVTRRRAARTARSAS